MNAVKEIIMKKRDEQNKGLKGEIIDKVVILATSAFGFVAALAWNDAVQSIFAKLGKQTSIAGKLGYAVVVTIVAVVVVLAISRIKRE